MSKAPIRDIENYREFLVSIPLAKYRQELKDIKWVEQDLPKEMLPLESIFRHYWFERKLLNFDEWFEDFWTELNTKPESQQALTQFKKYFFDKNGNGWFKKGFRARMYRTWVSLLTQLDFCYVFEYVCSKEGKTIPLECNAELDAKGTDAQVGKIKFQIKKVSQRKEARGARSDKDTINIIYVVWDIDELKEKIKNPRTRIKDTYQKMVNGFEKYLLKFPNGFIVFKDDYLKQIIHNIGNIGKLQKAVKKISLELSGE